MKPPSSHSQDNSVGKNYRATHTKTNFSLLIFVHFTSPIAVVSFRPSLSIFIQTIRCISVDQVMNESHAISRRNHSSSDVLHVTLIPISLVHSENTHLLTGFHPFSKAVSITRPEFVVSIMIRSYSFKCNFYRSH